MKNALIVLACILAAPNSYGRDTGYALECNADEGRLKQIISFLETDIDKRVRFLETNTNAMWDTHEWLSGNVTIRSFVQAKGNSEASLISYMEINMETMRAEFFKVSDTTDTTSMQCQRWSPRTRNK